MKATRRWFLGAVGKGSVALAFVVQLAAAARAFLPNVLYEPLKRFKLKQPDQYPQGYTFNADHRLFVVRDQERFHVISAVCTHLDAPFSGARTNSHVRAMAAASAPTAP